MSITAHSDPVAAVLHGNALEIYYLIHHPNVPSIKAIEEALRRTSPEERHDIAARAKVMIEVATTVQSAMPKEAVATK